MRTSQGIDQELPEVQNICSNSMLTNEDWFFLSFEEERLLANEALAELNHHQESEWYDTFGEIFKININLCMNTPEGGAN